ncbi:TPA: DNA recombination protein RmuC [Pseudomonas aeruginosa]|uniref:DNA recombination protein RmuC n=1 Tax=Pseudomonas aeruginosa TaxID=287 RepID=UPI00068C69C5|nr:DNA recombination protein RmuC [Pseudomonas aeruginosa]EIU5015085.1 DNA recombination protein RmuC [Pseudomonas aeruginosa]EIZ7652079.1 DNA recombination protein RmuC [Pseudomonas aeruginosa]EKM7584470.1 DNA recombination protein RmuC [Pseudomonas aeruginosa]EKQ6344934.1 DNA recombination protein RmuC [Pseudomonas aeruginosa]EKW9685289.1 DNA recombination protein RmuC [Pseudomonas aeruginosa]
MQASQWTPEIIVICAVLALAAAVIGFVLATLRQSRQINQLGAQLEQVAEAKTSTEAQSQILQSQLRESEGRSQALQVEEGKLKVQLQASVETNARLMQELQDHKAVASDLQVKLDQANRQHHEAAKRLEAAQTSVQGQQEQMRELRERLDTTSTAKTALQEERDRLKDALANEETRAKVAETSEHDARAQLAETKQQLHEQVKAFGELQERFNTLSSEHTKLKTTLSQREEHFQEQMTQLADARKSLTQEFENLANKIFEEKGKTFTQTSQTSIDGMLKPFREQIEGFQKRINEVHDASLQGNTSLNSEIKKVLEIGLQMSKEANNLTSALKGDSQQRGAWGEAQLRRTLEMSGLIEEAHYEVQAAFKDAEGRSKQTDYLIKLPDGKHIIIDSKVSLVAYDRAVGSESPEEYQLAMAEHVKAVRKHIDDLASKDYTNLAGIHSPDFVLMFMPIEPAYIEAMKHNKDLFEYGYKKHIVLVSHTTLIPILRTVANLWMIERSNAEAREISEKAGEIYNQVCLVAERIGKLGGTLNTASNHYNSAITALAGQQGLYGKIDRFSQLSAKVSKTLPTLEPVHVDFQNERLSLIVEALDESPEPNESLPQLPADDHEGEQSSHTETSLKNEFEFF